MIRVWFVEPQLEGVDVSCRALDGLDLSELIEREDVLRRVFVPMEVA